jgi:hypothetical protein
MGEFDDVDEDKKPRSDATRRQEAPRSRVRWPFSTELVVAC